MLVLSKVLALTPTLGRERLVGNLMSNTALNIVVQEYRKRYWNDSYFNAMAAFKPVAEKHGLTLPEIGVYNLYQ
jgi:hypothetical protein